MIRPLALALVLLWPGLGSGLAGAAVGCRDFPSPDRSHVVIVAEDMVLNGVPMAIRELRSQDPPDRILGFYRVRWEGQGQRVLETTHEPWRTLATQDGQCFYTAQTKPAAGGGTYALLGVTHAPNGATRTPGQGFPMMSGSRVFNDLAHKDGPKTARTVLLTNEFSPESNAVFYRNSLAGQGWVKVIDRRVDAGRGPGSVQVWRRGVEETSLTIDRDGGVTRVVANVVDRP